MRKTLRALLVLAFAAQSALAAFVAGPAALPPSAVTAAFGAAVGAQVTQTASVLSLRSAALTLSSLESIRSSYQAIKNPEQKAAATAVLAVLAAPAAEVPARLAATDIPAAAAERIEKAAAKLDAAAKKDPAFAAKVEAGRKANASLVQQAIAHPENVLPADLVATFRAFMDWGKAEAGAIPSPSEPAAPVRAGPGASGSTWAEAAAKAIADPSARPQVSFGAASFPILAMPTIGDDVFKLWTAAHDQSKSAIIAMYNFDDMSMAQSIVAAAKKGQKQVIVGDYSNWFPQRMQENIDMAKKTGKPLPSQSPAMKLIVANLGPNLELRILKGLGSFGINHNKFTVFTGADGKEFLEAGSFNYSDNSQNKHWENVIFSDDADRLSFYKAYHAWIYRRARPYSPNLQPLEPTFDPSDPIPTDASRAIVYHGVPFPKVTGSPNGGTEDWLVKAENLVQKTLDILMFSPFPTPNMSAVIESLLEKGIPVRMIADQSQAGHAGKILEPLLDKGMILKTIVGPDVVLHQQPWSHGSFMHEKVMIFDGAMADALAKMGDSLNISLNALKNNFENQEFWQGFHAAYMQAHFDVLWDLAASADKVLLQKLALQAEASPDGGTAAPAAAAATPVPAKPAPKPKR
ncbi:MAG TPA: phospholipase D-like domain-containing protein [Elusimicrobiota bacterium]|nr:phospholipase D-like domain-containing protein [Elusimicrobiota bacterium]